MSIDMKRMVEDFDGVTDREKAIVMAYTGYTMLAGDKLGIYYLDAITRTAGGGSRWGY